MMIIVGLGNPGAKFNKTRHNAGFMAVDFFAKENNFPDFEVSKKYESLISEKPFDTAQGENDILLIKPQTFMNDSGRAVTGYGLRATDLVVVHDDIDLPLGKIKFSKDSSAGGHKGVQSIIQHLGTKDFIRLKIGVATNEAKALDVVLEKFSPEEQKILTEVIKKSSEALQYFIENGIEKAMNEFNK